MSLDPSLLDAASLFSARGTNSAAGNPDRAASRLDSDWSERGLKDPLNRTQTAAAARMEDFKRLLEGSRYTPPADSGSGFKPATASFNNNNNFSGSVLNPQPTTPTAVRPTTTASPTPEWSAFKTQTKTDPREDFAKSAGLVGSPEKLQALPEFPAPTVAIPAATAAKTPSIATPVAPLKKNPATSFQLPKRGF